METKRFELLEGVNSKLITVVHISSNYATSPRNSEVKSNLLGDQFIQMK